MSRPARTLLWALLAFGLTALLMLAAVCQPARHLARLPLLLLTVACGAGRGYAAPCWATSRPITCSLLSTGASRSASGLAWRSLRWGVRAASSSTASACSNCCSSPSPTPSTSAPLPQAWRSPAAVEVAAIEIAALDLAGVQL